MADLAVIEQANADVIRSRILTIRGVQVMLDRDLAELYGVEVGQLNRQVKRNLERFPDDFMFQVSREECSRCQIGTLNGGRGSNIKNGGWGQTLRRGDFARDKFETNLRHF